MARSSASSNFQRERESIDNGEATPIGECRCGQQLKLITSWTNENPGRRFWLCLDNGMSKGCGFIQWFDPLMCKRSTRIIPGLLKRLNKQDEELKSLQMKLKLAVDNYWFKSWRFKVVMLV
ncbi:uncharacterized protein LOC116000450 [Ipomoea triloba]|uniref:uncharacterized protein LOC116000450 n=1 Tax=Ipomoea triloba TaxID=35885 RepID=UPI00125DFE1C|nr:uncharacterized protein LOC116000450 [Ipomoea triloba]